MVVVSTLRLAGSGLKLLQLPLIRTAQATTPAAKQCLAVQPIRQMSGHKRTIPMLPSNYEWQAWKDLLHYYVLLAAIPISVVIAYSNLVIGKAKLSDIPDDYEPQHWEYYKHPITRFFVKYLHEKPERVYEVNLHHINTENEKRKMRALEKKVKRLTAERQDVRTWSFMPVHSEQSVYAGLEARKSEVEGQGRS